MPRFPALDGDNRLPDKFLPLWFNESIIDDLESINTAIEEITERLEDLERFISGAAVMPTSGTWVAGTFVHNTAPVPNGDRVLLGWVRLTTGGAHVLDTDWAQVYGATI